MRALLMAPALALALAGYSSLTAAQTTAGTSATIVVPVIAQTASFSSEVTAYNPNAGALTVKVAFYDANNTTSPGPKTCTSLVLPAGRSAQFTVSTQCALPVGSNFGLLILSESTGTQRFYGYARAQTPQGVGFSTEGFPIENFNDQLQHATGLKRTAAGGGLPAFQTNCFVATLGDAVNYELRLFNGGTGAQLGGTLSGSLGVFQQFRYLDVFAAAGVAAGDKTNVRAQFTNLTGSNKKLIGFCTVQDNTTFSADFRIAKSYGGTPQNAFVQGGNAFGTTALLGTVDNQPLTLIMDNQPVMRYSPGTFDTNVPTGSPNVAGGHPNNSVGAFSGQTVAGGGMTGTTCLDPSTGTDTRPCANQTSDDFATVGGGSANLASSISATVAGGESNTASGIAAIVGGGSFNTASNAGATVGGGNDNTASGDASTVSGGSGNTAAAFGSMVPGGLGNSVAGRASFAAGENAFATTANSFVWGDGARDALPAADRTFTVQATGGIDLWPGNQPVTIHFDNFNTCSIGNSSANWTCTSDRERKGNFAEIDKTALLRRLIAMPIESWSFKGYPEVVHIGPVAQDFHAAFNVGDRSDDRHIDIGDSQGIALAAIQGLNSKLEERVAELQREITDLRERMSAAESVRADVVTLRTALAELQRSRETMVAK